MKTFISLFFILMALEDAWGQNKKLLPHFAALQYAGSIGFASAGFGYHFFNKKLNTSLHYGYVPRTKGGELHILSVKLLYNTASINLSDKLEFDPFAAGLMVSYHFGSQFSTHWPGHYPEGYYWWRTSIRPHLNMQSALTQKLNNKLVTSVTFYIDLNISELYLVSYLQNYRSLTLRETVKVGYGIRANF